MKDQHRPLARVPLAGRLAGKIAVITGGANGMGRAAVQMFAEAGAKVAVLDIAAAAGRELEAEQTALGRDVMFVETDVTQTAAVRAACCASAHGTCARRLFRGWGSQRSEPLVI